MNGPNVLRVNAVEEQTAERSAVRQILLNLQRDERLTLIDIAERIDVSLGTISNAANGKVTLSGTYIKRLGLAFGGHYLDPYLALMGCRATALQTDNVRDILPLLTRATLKVAEARDPAGPGGEREIHSEQLGYLPHLEALVREAEAMICRIRKLAA